MSYPVPSAGVPQPETIDVMRIQAQERMAQLDAMCVDCEQQLAAIANRRNVLLAERERLAMIVETIDRTSVPPSPPYGTPVTPRYGSALGQVAKFATDIG